MNPIIINRFLINSINLHITKMVCSKCQKKLKSTELATPGVKNKNDMYYGSPSTTLGGGSKGKSTLGATGVGKVSLNPLWDFMYFFEHVDEY